MIKKIKMSDENDEIDGLLDSLLDEITDVEDPEKKKKKDLTPRVIGPKSVVIKPVSVQIDSKSKTVSDDKPIQLPKPEKSIQEQVIERKTTDQKPKLKNIERLRLQGEAKRLGIPFEELLKRRGLTGEIKVPPKPKPKPIKKEEDRLVVKKEEPEVKKASLKPKPLNLKPSSEPKVYRASMPISSKEKPIEERTERIKKIKFTEKLKEDTIGYSSPLGFRQKKSAVSSHISIVDDFSLDEEEEKLLNEELEPETQDDKPFVPNVGGIPLFADDTTDTVPDEELVHDESGMLTKAYGLKCPQCGNRFEQQDPERAECTKCGHVFWV